MEISEEQEQQLRAELSAAVEVQTTKTKVVVDLKKEKATKEAINAAVEEMKVAKAEVDRLTKALQPPSELAIRRDLLLDLLVRRFFVLPSFGVYGGSKGLYDLGPPGSAMKNNLLQFWRQHFTLAESMLEVDTSSLTPAQVFEVSGHTEKFIDIMVQDTVTGEAYRADHLLEDEMEKRIADKKTSTEDKAKFDKVKQDADNFTLAELTDVFKSLDVKSPEGNELGAPYEFNLMFQTNLGPKQGSVGFLRPELAQGIMVNFNNLLTANNNQLPFAGCCVGQAYRNEISPKQHLLRVREFTLAEIEHFIWPDKDEHDKFDIVKDIAVRLYSADSQTGNKRLNKTTIGEAHAQNIISSQTLAYFVARTQLFLLAVGVKEEFLRFRQHRKNEMAHYARDCWDAEILTSYGWVECVGVADRSAYDLTVHGNFLKKQNKFSVFRKFDEPKVQEILRIKPQMKILGKELKKAGKLVANALVEMEGEEGKAEALQESLKSGSHTLVLDGNEYVLKPNMIEFKRETVKVEGENIIPSVIEPSFGVGRILYAVLEHCFYYREDDGTRGVLALSPVVAPVKCSVLPLTDHESLQPFVTEISEGLNKANVSHKVDAVAKSIGRRYARTDEIGIPFGVTIDFDTVKERTVTLRERDTMKQVRVPIDEVFGLLDSLSRGVEKWSDVCERYPAFNSGDDK